MRTTITALALMSAALTSAAAPAYAWGHMGGGSGFAHFGGGFGGGGFRGGGFGGARPVAPVGGGFHDRFVYAPRFYSGGGGWHRPEIVNRYYYGGGWRPWGYGYGAATGAVLGMGLGYGLGSYAYPYYRSYWYGPAAPYRDGVSAISLIEQDPVIHNWALTDIDAQDGHLTYREEETAARDLLARFDYNHDGRIEADEYRFAIAALAPGTPGVDAAG